MIKHDTMLRGLEVDSLPKQAIHTLSEDLLERFTDVPLLSRYDVYQRLMDYWAEVMQDDVYLIAADGWTKAAQPRAVIDDKARKIRETPDLTIGRKKYKMDLIPPDLIMARYFMDEQAAIDAAQAVADSAAQAVEEYIEEHSGEEGLLEDAANDKGKITKTGLKEMLNAIGKDPVFAEERKAAKHALKLMEKESLAKKQHRALIDALEAQVLATYPDLTEDEIKALTVDDKWFTAIKAGIDGEVQAIAQRLAGRVRELDERYAEPLPKLEQTTTDLGATVANHLKKMGLAWA